MNHSQIYLALLRGINVGGNNKIEMKKLKECFEKLGLDQVKTYINTGNVLFTDSNHPRAELARQLEKAIKADFDLEIKVLLVTYDQLKKIVSKLPNSWVNNDQMKSDVLFLWESIDSKAILKQLPLKDGIDEVIYVAGAILWRVDRDQVTKSGLLKIVGTKLYSQMTVRNCNTTRKLLKLMEAMTPHTTAE